VPQPYKGRRIKLTVRLPYDVHAEAAVRAKARRWNMSEYVGWCVEQAVNPSRVRAQERIDPTQPHYGDPVSRQRRQQAKQAASG
jgi:hypothetical protein